MAGLELGHGKSPARTLLPGACERSISEPQVLRETSTVILPSWLHSAPELPLEAQGLKGPAAAMPQGNALNLGTTGGGDMQP